MQQAVATDFAAEALSYLQRARTLRTLGFTFGRPGSEEEARRSGVTDPLTYALPIYDTDVRLYAGFSKALWLALYGRASPFWPHATGPIEPESVPEGERKPTALSVLFLSFLHRATGSGIDYRQPVSGYHNSLLTHVTKWGLSHHLDMQEAVRGKKPTFATGGYQVPRFGGKDALATNQRMAQWYVNRGALLHAEGLANWLQKSRRTLDEAIEFMNGMNKGSGLPNWHFVHAAVAADVADFLGDSWIDTDSAFPAGTNALRCLSLQFDKPRGMKPRAFVDSCIRQMRDWTGLKPYDIEDCGACDVMRWLENYIPHSRHWKHHDRDKLFCEPVVVKDFHLGRQRWMLDAGLVKTFNDPKQPHRGDAVIKAAGLTREQAEATARSQRTSQPDRPCLRT